MNSEHGRTPAGRPLRVLIAEDQALIAMTLDDLLTTLGVEVVGPVASLSRALQVVEEEGESLDGALLDVNLHGDAVYPVADALMYNGRPFAFLTGYGPEGVDKAYRDYPVLTKPCGVQDLKNVLALFEEQARAEDAQ